MKTKKVFFVLALVLLLGFSVELYAKQNLPSTMSPAIAKSYDGRYLIEHRDSAINNPVDEGGLDYQHKLFLIDAHKNYDAKSVYEYSRSVDVSWAPKSYSFFVNDHVGSDSADCVIFRLDQEIKKTSIYDELNKLIPKNKTIFKQAEDPQHFNHHVYITCNKWLEDNKLLVRIYGYGDIDPDGFTLWYKYTFNAGFQFVKKEKGYY